MPVSGDVRVSSLQCGKCKKELRPEEHPCSVCGSTTRMYSVTVTSSVTVNSSLRAVARTPSGFKKVEQVVRDKFAGLTKRLAREVLRIDRTHPDVTKKVHHVEEQDEQGRWHVMHHEEKENPAKRPRQ